MVHIRNYFFSPFTHQCTFQLKDSRRSKAVLWSHLAPPAPSTKRIAWTLLPVELPADQRREFPSLRVTSILSLCLGINMLLKLVFSFKIIDAQLYTMINLWPRHLDTSKNILFKKNLNYIKLANAATLHAVLPYCPMLTSTGVPPGSVARLRGLTSLLLRWTWYTFSVGTQDRGLSSGGMVTPYSQPVRYKHTNMYNHTIRQYMVQILP